MGIRWKQLLGNTERFALELRFDDDPDGGVGSSIEMSRSWGSFQLWVRGQNLCAHTEEGETVEFVHWYLLPMLEWFATNWVPLLHETKAPLRNAGDGGWSALEKTAFPPAALPETESWEWESRWADWWRRHSLLACREGGLFPDVVLRRWHDRMEVSWGESQLAGMPDHYRFLASQGVERVSPTDVAKPLFEVLRAAVDFLLQETPHSARLKRLDQTIRRLPNTTADEQLSWMVGLGKLSGQFTQQWKSLRDALAPLPRAADALWSRCGGGLVAQGTCQVALMFGSASPTLNSDDVMALARESIGSYSRTGQAESRQLKKLVRDEPAPLDTRGGWTDGYRLAEELLKSLGLAANTANQIDITAILKRLKINVGEIHLSDMDIRAVAIASPRHVPTIRLCTSSPFNKSEEGKRFTLAHELCHILFDRATGKELALISGPWAPPSTERRANAFAAMLLMPTALVRRIIGKMTVREDTGDGVRELAKRMRTSLTATLEHLGNLQQWDDATRDRVRAEIAD